MVKMVVVSVLALFCVPSYASEFSFGFSYSHGRRPWHHYRHDYVVHPHGWCGPRYVGLGVVVRPGYYEYRTERVVIREAYVERVNVAPVYEERTTEKGEKIKVLVSEGYVKEIYHPARYGERTVKVWVP